MRRAAAIVFGSGGNPVPCVVWDMSASGARLAIARSPEPMPTMFTLALTRGSRAERKCEVVWTDNRFVGVRFV